MANRKTNKEWFVELKAFAEANGRADFAEFIQGRIDALDKKAESKKPTKTQEENEVIKGAIIDFLETVEQASPTEVMNGVDGVNSTQKATALLRQLEVERKVIKLADKKKVFYKVVTD